MTYGGLQDWKPQIGDVICKDGIFNRWMSVITAINGDQVSVRQAGNPRLLAQGDFVEVVLNIKKVKSAMVGSYYVVQNNAYFV